MAHSPVTIQRIVWVALPAALLFVLQGIRELTRGSGWSAAAYAVFAVLLISAPAVARGRILNDRRAIGYAAAGGVGILAWLFGPTSTIRVLGFCVAVFAHSAAILTARRSGTDGPPIRDDSAVELDLNRR